MTEHANVLAPDPRLRAPLRALPSGTVDCHAHIFDRFERYPLAGTRKYSPPLCTREAWLALHALLGVERGVQVHGSPYGFDNSITADFLREHPGRFVGVAVVGTEVTDAELKRLDAAGFRAARLMDQYATGATTAMLELIARRVAPLGWHIEINIARSGDWVELEPRLRRCPVPLVFDHLGRVRGGEGIDAPGFNVVRRLLAEREDCWTKISSFYRLSDSGPPHYDDMRAIVRTLLDERPDRCVWGTNWPHPGLTRDMPNDADLLDLLESWLPGDAVRAPLLA
ncbi:MAG: amidohydrolase family protein, partial [Betaproteobacteria bacterium]|nr:amidohydrolase family protein [Betaproteobacteria bacterium]